jgi:hypothetical protein
MLLLVRMSLYTNLVLVGLLEFSFIQLKKFVRSSDCMWERLIRNSYSGTELYSRLLDTGVWFADITAFCMTHRQ